MTSIFDSYDDGEALKSYMKKSTYPHSFCNHSKV